MNPHEYNPFPYPPTFLLVLAPLGALGLAGRLHAFHVDERRALRLGDGRRGACAGAWSSGLFARPPPASTLISGQTGFLSGGADDRRAAPCREPADLVGRPVRPADLQAATRRAGPDRAGRGGAVAHDRVGGRRPSPSARSASSLAFGFDIWPTWAKSIVEYGAQFDLVVDLMPTIYANALGCSGAGAGLRSARSSASRFPSPSSSGAPSARARPRAAQALLILGTFLATPHAFNYDMPMTTAAVARLSRGALRQPARGRGGRGVALVLMLLLPFSC